MNNSSTTLSCQDCQAEFVFTEREQQFFKDKGFQPPKRCPDCRKRKKERKTQEPNFNR